LPPWQPITPLNSSRLFVGIEGRCGQRRRISQLDYQSPVAFEAQFINNQKPLSPLSIFPGELQYQSGFIFGLGEGLNTATIAFRHC